MLTPSGSKRCLASAFLEFGSGLEARTGAGLGGGGSEGALNHEVAADVLKSPVNWDVITVRLEGDAINVAKFFSRNPEETGRNPEDTGRTVATL